MPKFLRKAFIYLFYLVIEVPDHVYVLFISSSISDCCISIFRFSWCCLSYSDYLPPSAFRAYTCVYVARVKVIASRMFLTISVTWFAIHVSSSAAVTSRFLTSRVLIFFNGFPRTIPPPKDIYMSIYCLYFQEQDNRIIWNVCSRIPDYTISHLRKLNPQFMRLFSGFDGLDVACWPLVPKFAGSHPAENIGFLGRKKNP